MPTRFTSSSSLPRVPCAEEPPERAPELADSLPSALAGRHTTRMSQPLLAGRAECAEDLPDASPDPVAHDRPAHAAAGRDAEPVMAQLVATDADRHQRGGPGCGRPPAARRSRAVRAASLVGSSHGTRVVWARRRQAVSFWRPLARRRGQHLAATLGLHAGAEAMLLGAMSLLGLIRLLRHRWA